VKTEAFKQGRDIVFEGRPELATIGSPERALWGLLVRTVDIGGGEKAAYSSYPLAFPSPPVASHTRGLTALAFTLATISRI
jgi:hypothetical protein